MMCCVVVYPNSFPNFNRDRAYVDEVMNWSEMKMKKKKLFQ